MTTKLLSLSILLGLTFTGCTIRIIPDSMKKYTTNNSASNKTLSTFDECKIKGKQCNTSNNDEKYYCNILNDYIDGTVKESDKKIKSYLSNSEVDKGVAMMTSMGLSEKQAKSKYKKDHTGRYYTEKKEGIIFPDDATKGTYVKNQGVSAIEIEYQIKGKNKAEREEKALKKYNELIAAFNNIFKASMGKSWFQYQKQVSVSELKNRMNKNKEDLHKLKKDSKLEVERKFLNGMIDDTNHFENVSNHIVNRSKDTTNEKIDKFHTLESKSINKQTLMYSINMSDLTIKAGLGNEQLLKAGINNKALLNAKHNHISIKVLLTKKVKIYMPDSVLSKEEINCKNQGNTWVIDKCIKR